MLTQYDHYVLLDNGVHGQPDHMMHSPAVCSSSSVASEDGGAYQYAAGGDMGCWQTHPDQTEDAYTLTVLSDSGPSSTDLQQPPPPPYAGVHSLHDMQAWGSEPWQQHGPAHAVNPFADDAVSGSDGSSDISPDRRCVRSLLHVALAKGGSFAQQFNSCGVPPLDQQHLQQQHLAPSPAAPPPPPYYMNTVVKQEPGVYVSSTSCSPRPVTPAESLRSCYSPASSSPYMQLHQHSDDAVVSTTSSYPHLAEQHLAEQQLAEQHLSDASCFSPAPPSYSAFRTPYPTPSPDHCYPPRPEPYPAALVPLPVHLMSATPVPSGPSTPPPSSRAAKRRRNRAAAAAAALNGGATPPPPRKRERSERQLHPCTLCDKRFKDNYSVNVHMRTHTGEKPFPCIVCGKMFRQKAHLAKHRSTHQAEEWAAAAAASVSGTLSGRGHNAPALTESVESVDSNSNSLPLWSESKCKAPNVWTPSLVSPPLSSVQ